jgi:quercetin dioxygenase-like cupin family protein
MELRRLTLDYAADPATWGPLLRYANDEHWSIRVHADDNVDIWLITWLQAQSTSLHDHGDSAGAFTVVSGRLCEYQANGDRLEVRAESSRSFGVGYAHDVYNPYEDAAVSVHAYSPPLTSMNYYEKTPGGLKLISTQLTHIPEGSPAA